MSVKNPASPASSTVKSKSVTDLIAEIEQGLLPENNLSELTDAGDARDNLGLGDSAVKDVGTTASDVAAGDAPAAAQAAAIAASIPKTTANAQSLIGAIADDTPIAIDIPASRLFGRKATGDIGPMTGAEAAALLPAPTATMPSWMTGTWTYDSSSTTMADPGAGKVRFSSGTTNNVAKMALSTTDANASTISVLLTARHLGDVFEFIDNTSGATFRYMITGVTSASGYVEVRGKVYSRSGTVANGDSLSVRLLSRPDILTRPPSSNGYLSPLLAGNLVDGITTYQRTYYVPISLPEVTFETLHFRCDTGMASSVVRLGAWRLASDFVMYRLADFGTVSTASAGSKSLAGLSFTPSGEPATPGQFFLSVTLQGASGAMLRGATVAMPSENLPGVTFPPAAGFYEDSIAGALAADSYAAYSGQTVTDVPVIYIKAAA